jgi:hypothetical protein
MNYKPSFPRTASNGAKEGLEKKMSYWQDKDYQYQFAVTLGQALNLAFGKHEDSMQLPSRDTIYEIFNMLLTAKSDVGFIEAFDEYYANSKKSFKESTTDESGKQLPIVRIG